MPQSQPVPSRRGFFFGAAAVGAATAAIATLPQSQAPKVVAEVHPPVPANGGGYHLSEHVKRYYKTTRL